MKHFDFILFENYRLAENHWFDVELIARIFHDQGMSVAIFDLYNRYDSNEVNGIEILHWTPLNMVPDDRWMMQRHSKIETLYKAIGFRWQQYIYCKEAKKFIENKADNFYCGSYHNGMSVVFFEINKPCYWWGLRSDRFRFSLLKLLSNPFKGIDVLIEKFFFLRNPMQRLFVSNQIIKDEHEKLGVSCDRIIIREERCVETIGSPKLDRQTKNISFLVIGMLRKEKQVPVTISAFKGANIPGAILKLVGSSRLDYEKIIEKAMGGDKRIIRKNEFLNYSDFNQAFQESHFVLFADIEGPSCITNGTMIEALINYRPVICPDYNPYKYYVEKYHIGLVYESKNIKSYSETLKKASELGTIFFIPAIEQFLLTIQFDQVAKQLVKAVNNVGK